MKLSKLKKGNRIEITWLDSNNPEPNHWTQEDKFQKRNPRVTICSCCYFQGMRKGFVNTSADRSLDNGKFELLVNRMLSIPVGCIVKVRKLR